MGFIGYTQECLDAAQGLWPASGDHEGHSRRERPRTIRVFKNGLLELTSKAHPVTPIVWFGPVIAYGLYTGGRGPFGVLGTFELFCAGLLAWTLLEYGMHRLFFHGLIRNAHTPGRKFQAFMAHGYHHEFPDDPMRLVMPPMISWPLALAVGGLYRWALGPLAFMPALAGTMVGYISYDWIHYYTHHARPRTALGKWLRRYHMRHHFESGDSFYGISSPLWDVVFGTFRGNRQPGGDSHGEAASV